MFAAKESLEKTRTVGFRLKSCCSPRKTRLTGLIVRILICSSYVKFLDVFTKLPSFQCMVRLKFKPGNKKSDCNTVVRIPSNRANFFS